MRLSRMFRWGGAFRRLPSSPDVRSPPGRGALLFLLVLMAQGCSDGGTGVSKEVAIVEVNPAADTLFALGATVQLSAVAKNPKGNVITGTTFLWSSSDPEVLMVTPSGLATAVANGIGTVRAEASGVSGLALILVQQSVAVMEVGPTPVALKAGEAVQLTAQVSDANGHVVLNPGVTWASSNHMVASVSTTGLVSGISPGTVTITAEADGVSQGATVSVLTVELGLMRDLIVDPYLATLRDHVSPAMGGALSQALEEVSLGMAQGDTSVIQAGLAAARAAVADAPPSDAPLAAVLDLILTQCERLLDQD